ncbi:hypothetical protein PHMEG_00028558 [Phytophthora megakarya]|uniref:Necrosis inducing protein NPP1 n=1 Tax=Phytophthora megakarya TaxID=4795 RepID=A0A225V682_9STRA|nr:hypothetical protein PHMEG_00028558 [Phytophthora megakarya]
MNLPVLVTIIFAALVTCADAATDHDKIQPIPQPEPVTVAEKAAVKFKPQLITPKGACVSFPAISANGDVTGGLKGTNGDDACGAAPLGSQVYGRSGWYKDVWAIMYTWYFPKSFSWFLPSGRHDWQSVVVWIDNPDVETPKILGVSMSSSGSSYKKERNIVGNYFSGFRVQGTRHQRHFTFGSQTTLRFEYFLDLGSAYLYFSSLDGNFQDLIMWEQLTDAARGSLNDQNNFGDEEVPFNEGNYEKHLEKAWPF